MPVELLCLVDLRMPRLSGLFIYPVKSCRAHALREAAVDAWGLQHDRRYLVVTPEGQFLTQRQIPRMALIETELSTAGLALASPNYGSVAIPSSVAEPARTLSVTIWRNTVLADDCGEPTAEWLTRFLGTPARLVRMGNAYDRPVKPSKAQPGDIVSFADAYPFLLLSEASLHDLNDRIVAHGGEAVPLDRFRANLVLTDCAPYFEDSLTRFRIGEVVFRNAGPCARCIVTTTDQDRGERDGPEPLRTLATYRRDAHEPSNVNFAANVIHETKSGRLRLGDELSPL